MPRESTRPIPAHDDSLDETPDGTFGPLLRVQPGFAALTALFAACGWSLFSIAVEQGNWASGPVAFTAIFTVALLVLIAAHEAAHAVTGHLHGHRLIGVRLGSKLGVTMLGDHTPRSMLVTAAAGPIVGTGVAVAVLVLADPWSPVWVAGTVALLENVANVVLFFLPGSDGSKIVAAVRDMVARRRRRDRAHRRLRHEQARRHPSGRLAPGLGVHRRHGRQRQEPHPARPRRRGDRPVAPSSAPTE